MRIILNELKKIWDIKILAIIAVLCVLYFLFSMSFFIATFPSNLPSAFSSAQFHEYARYLTERYGATLEQDEFEEFILYRSGIIAEINQFIQANPVLAAMGIFNYEDYEIFAANEADTMGNGTGESQPQRFYSERRVPGEDYAEGGGQFESERQRFYSEETSSDDAVVRHEMEINEHSREGGESGRFGGQFESRIEIIGGSEELNIVFNELAGSPVFSELMSFDMLVNMYVNRDERIDSTILMYAELIGTPVSERAVRRLNEIRESGEYMSIITQHTLNHTLGYGQRLGVLAVLAALILVSRLITTDRSNRVNWLQYTSRQGRRILTKQFVAVILSAVGMTTLLVLIFAGIYSVNGTQVFWNNSINSFMGFPYHWLSITFGQYCLLIIGVIYVLSVGTAMCAFILSRFSRNLVMLIFKVIPFFIAVMLLSNWVLDHFLSVFDGGNDLTKLSALAFALVVGVVTAAVIIHKEKRVELT